MAGSFGALPHADGIPSRIGPYRIRGVLGEGGMGVVYLAEQDPPLARLVALKVLKDSDGASRSALRFRVEMEALARADHPGIARIHETGRLEDGRPYFVMEHLEGDTLVRHCDRERLGVGERLVLFLRVCEAVEYAHRIGVLHRDLKPSNILVTGTGADARVRVIDFGMARIAGPLPGMAPITSAGAVVGTLAYMSPEQAGAGTDPVDTRADVYSLGVILYELLLGVLPRPAPDPAAGPLRAIRSVQSSDAAPAGDRIGAGPEDWPAIASLRGTSPATLKRSIQGDLECILAKALRRTPSERYESVADLRADLRLHLEGLPVRAHPPGRAYIVGKLLRRNRAAAVSFALILLAAAGTAGSFASWVLHGEAAERDRRSTIRVTGEIRSLVTGSHLWLEELLTGDATVDPEVEVYRPMDRAIDLAQAVREGRRTDLAKVQVDEQVAGRFRSLEERVRGLRERARGRASAGRRTAGAGSVADREYDAAFQAVVDQCVDIATTLDPGSAPVKPWHAAAIAAALALALGLLFLGVRRGIAF